MKPSETVMISTKQVDFWQKEINKLKEQLNTATRALKGISVWANTGNGGEQAVKNLCKKALKEMGVK